MIEIDRSHPVYREWIADCTKDRKYHSVELKHSSVLEEMGYDVYFVNSRAFEGPNGDYAIVSIQAWRVLLMLLRG